MTDGRFSNQLPNWINLKEANIYKLLDDSWRKEKKKPFFMFRLTAHESRVRVCAVYTLFKKVCFKFYFEFISCICQKQHLRNSEPALQDRHLHISHQPITWQHEDTVETTSRSSNRTSERGRKAIRVALDAKEHL